MAEFNVGDRVKNKSNNFGEIFFIAKNGEQKPIAVHFECEFRGHNCASCKESKKIAKEKYKEDSNCWWYDEEELEKVENMDKMKEFTKSDLKVGYVLKCVDHENNDKEFLQKVENGRTGICLSGEYTWFPLDCLDENMRYKKYCTDLEVIEIYGFATNDAAWKLDTRERHCLYKKPKKSPLQIELESLEQQQREIADKIAELRKKCN